MGDNPLGKACGLSPRAGGQIMVELLHSKRETIKYNKNEAV